MAFPKERPISGSFLPPKNSSAMSMISVRSCGANMLAWTRSIIGLSPCAILIVTLGNRRSTKNLAHFAVVLHRECCESVTGFPAVTFLDDKPLPATSNPVERGNRRHRKMQRSVYLIRSKECQGVECGLYTLAKRLNALG